MKTPRQILIDARKLIEKPENHTRYVFNDHGRFCSLGAIRHVCHPQDNPLLHGATVEVLQKEMKGSVVAFNDTHTHPEVLAAFDRAIASLT